MRAASSTLRELIADTVPKVTWVADLMYDRERRLANVPIESPRVSWDAGQFVAGDAQVRVAWSDDLARSMVPKVLGDWFSPFGAELQLDVILGAGTFAERVPMGRLVIEKVPDARERAMLFQGRPIFAGQSFGLELRDPLIRVQRDEFPFPKAPGSSSVWQEIQSVSGMPVVRNLPDASIPAGTVYEGRKSDQLSKLFDVIGGWPMTDASGALTARPKAWGDPVDVIRGVVDAPVSMDSGATHNRVIVEGKAPDGSPLFGVADVADGFLRVRNADGSSSPFGISVKRYASDQLTTQAQVDAYAHDLLPRVSRVRGVTRRVVEPLNPLRELGDVLEFDGGLVRVASISHSAATTELVVEVPDAG